MANYKKTYNKKGEVKLTELTPEEAKAMIEEQENAKLRDKSKEAEPAHVEPEDRAAKEASLLGSTKEAIQLRKAEIRGELLLKDRLTQSKLQKQLRKKPENILQFLEQPIYASAL